MRPEYEKVLDEIAEKQGLSRERALEQAVALYQLIHFRMEEDYRFKMVDQYGKRHPDDMPVGLAAFDEA